MWYEKVELGIFSLFINNNECLERKKKCHIFFDQIGDSSAYEMIKGETPMYGVSLLEAASFGSVCMSHANFPNTPLIHVKNAHDIYNAILDLVNNPEKLKALCSATREWVVREHGYESVAKRFIKSIEAGMK